MSNSITLHGKYIPGLDGVRGLAILLVLFSHSVIFDQFNGLATIGTQAGYMGVSIFFVLSGYLITKLLLLEEANATSISLPLFYIRRALRLFPALWLYLFTVLLLSYAGFLPRVSWHSFIASLLYIRNLVGQGHETAHLWSLSLEEQFYILWPVAVVLCRRNSTRLALALTVFCLVGCWRWLAAAENLASFGALHIRTDLRFDAPLAGCILAIVEAKYRMIVFKLNIQPLVPIFCFVAGIAILAEQLVFGGDTWLWLAFGPTINASAGVLLILSQIGASSPLPRLLATPPLVVLGKISYGVYLWQEMFLGPKLPGFHGIRNFPIGLALTLSVSVLSFYVLEKPLLRLKRKFYQRLNPIATPVGAAV